MQQSMSKKNVFGWIFGPPHLRNHRFSLGKTAISIKSPFREIFKKTSKMEPKREPKSSQNRSKNRCEKRFEKRASKILYRRNARGCRGDYRGVKNKQTEGKQTEGSRMKGAIKGECKGGVQKVECKRGECRGGSAERQPTTHVNTLVCLRPRADKSACAHSAGP